MIKPKEPPENILGEPHVADFLVYLLDRGEAMATEMRAILKNYYGIVQTARKLEQAGLITVEIETSPRVMHIYRLTQKGKKVAEKLKEIEEIIERD